MFIKVNYINELYTVNQYEYTKVGKVCNANQLLKKKNWVMLDT